MYERFTRQLFPQNTVEIPVQIFCDNEAAVGVTDTTFIDALATEYDVIDTRNPIFKEALMPVV
jgi:hypothetical protein